MNAKIGENEQLRRGGGGKVPPGADLNVDLGFATAGTVVAGVRVEINVEWGWVGLRVTVGVEEGDKEGFACEIDGGKIVIGEVCSPV